MAAPDNTLAYIDQASFHGLQALGRGPIMQYIWIYRRPVDMDGLRRFHRNLAGGLLGRRIECSPLPIGRHRWVAAPGPAGIDLASAERSSAQVWDFLDEHVALPVDPGAGPSWRLGVQPLTDGGAAVSLIASHSVADGQGFTIAVTDAVNGVDRGLGYPPPGSRTRSRALREDARAVLRAVPSMGRAVAAAVAVARSERADLATSFQTMSAPPPTGDDRPVVAPNVSAFIDIDEWDRIAKALGGTSNSLFAGLAARLGARLGRVDADGLVKLSWPVSERTPGDTRANALIATHMTADPAAVTRDLAGVRVAMKQALSESAEMSARLMGPLPLTPLTPKALVRRLEAMVVSVNSPIGCSNMGDLDPAVNRPDGTDADYLSLRLLEPRITSRELNQMNGYLGLVSGRVHGRLFVAAGGWTAGGDNSRAAMRAALAGALDDFGVPATFEV
ncbi:hypothetical protein C1S82_27640 [Mycolicibacterium cosmeticum]|uniref:Fatty acyl-AMP ligase FadD28 and polyketide synthase n=1 Tax=Mycolicibacterium cosmeticum TaxID=258533 RepID=W9ASY3_MYCCO|nr:hypothetical protein [Mycolicibacterium cosmeticum]TLH67740.1 hypothetical protein C1S82_27640 [Mycolicibacterium cosmeticum]CDO08588.1 Fatty acyl-AMP ligase FadD28 and polyketide synthase [Mycolicibacterium cosmeticum]